MKTLTEHNAERRKIYEEARERSLPHANGIACPECGKELWDSDPRMTLTSNPPQKDIYCPACGYHGFRVA